MRDQQVSVSEKWNNSGIAKRRSPGSPIVSLHSFVLGFFVGCVMIYFCVCIGSSCVIQTTPISPVQLDAPIPRERSLKITEDIKTKITPTHKVTEEIKHGTGNDSTACPNRLLHVVILVLASPQGALRRNAIRGSWMHSYNSKSIKVTSKFLLGTLGLAKSKVASLQQEYKQYGDMLLFDSLKDSYFNLSLKVLHGLNWVERELPHFDFVIKTDDDSFVRVEKVAKAFIKMGCPELLYWGYFNGHGFPEPTGKWAEKNWHSCPHYLPYAMGGGYVLTQKVVKLLVRLSDRLLLYNNEDVTVGSWMAPFELVRVHDMRFNVESVTHGCNNEYIITHKDTARIMFDKYKNLRKNGTLCSPEKEIRPGFLYDWTASPLDCCNRTRGLAIQQSVYNSHLLSLEPPS